MNLSTKLHAGEPYLRSLLSFPSHRCTRSSSFFTLMVAFSLTSARLKIENMSCYLSAADVCGTASHLIYVTIINAIYHTPNSPKTHRSLIFQHSLFLKNVKPISVTVLFLLMAISIKTDISGIEQADRCFISYSLLYITLNIQTYECKPLYSKCYVMLYT